MNRAEFYEKASQLDEDALHTALWTLYWRGTAHMRERIEAQLDPQQAAKKQQRAQPPPEPERVRREVREFAELAHSGAYLAGDRRVSPKERSRWRMTFRRLATDAQAALRHEDVVTGATALELLVNLACETRETDLFRSEDPMQAAGFVVSDVVEAMWSRVRDRHGFHAFAQRAARQLIRWEWPYGWTRYGIGSVAEKETTLAAVLERMLEVPDHWETFAARYLEALDAAAAGDEKASRRRWRAREEIREDRAWSLAEWHELLLERLHDGDDPGLMERVSAHPALAGAERTYLEAVLAHRWAEHDRARELIGRCVDDEPGNEHFLAAARRFG